MIFEKGSRTDKNTTYRKLRRIWGSMMDRCYNESSHAYKNYGNRGVVVSEKWQTLNGFLETIDKVDGWDLDKFLKGELVLDKDFKNRSNLEYSLENCTFISLSENNKIKPTQQKEIVGISPTKEEYRFYNQSEFARTHGLRQTTISECVNGKIKTHKGWEFKYVL